MLERVAAALAATQASLALQESNWAIPALQTAHLIGIGLAFTAAALVTARRLRGGRGGNHGFRPWLWIGLGLIIPSGALLVLAEPERALLNPLFQAKMAMLAVVLALTLPVLRGRAAPRLSVAIWLVGWVAVITAGRWIGYTLG